jgi:hypothetical protein
MTAVRTRRASKTPKFRVLNGGVADLRVGDVGQLTMVLSAIEFIKGPLTRPEIAHEEALDAWVVSLTHYVERPGAAELVPVVGKCTVYLPEQAMAIVRRLRDVAQDLLRYEIHEAMYYKGAKAF